MALALMVFLLLAGCSFGGGPSQKEIEDLLSQARVDTAAKQYKDAEKKLLQCLHHADKNTQLYLRLAALNQLVDLELARKNESKAKSYVWEAGAIGEELARSSSDKPHENESRLLSEARKAMVRWADDYAEVGHFDSAKTLYTKAQVLETRSGETVNPEDSADYRLKKLDERISGEKQAIDHDNGLVDEKDPRYQARMERTKARRKLMEQIRALNEEMARKPDKETAKKMLALLEQILKKCGVREVEYRAALCTTVQYSFQFGNREKALSLLKEDIAKFDNIKQSDIDRADPTALENANYLITDLSQFANLMTQVANIPEACALSERGLKLAEQVQFHNCVQHADLFKSAAWCKERQGNFAEAIRLRNSQIEMLKALRQTSKNAVFYEAHLELGRDLSAAGKPKEGLSHLNFAINRYKVEFPNTTPLAYAYQSKAEVLRQSGNFEGAYESMRSAMPIWEKKGNLGQQFNGYRVYGKILRLVNKREEARQVDLKALECCLRLPAEQQRQESPDCYHELAILESDKGRHKKAYEYLKHAFDAQLKARGEADFTAAGMLNFLAALQAKMGNNAESEKLRLRALEACRKSKETPRTPMLSTLLQLANHYQISGPQGKAEKLYREVISMEPAGSDPLTIHYMRMARVQLAQAIFQKNKEEAIKLKDEALAKLPSTNGSAGNDAAYYLTLGDLCLNLADFEPGEKCYNEAEKIALSCKPPLSDLHFIILTRKRDLYKVTKRPELMVKAEAQLTSLKKQPQAQ